MKSIKAIIFISLFAITACSTSSDEDIATIMDVKTFNVEMPQSLYDDFNNITRALPITSTENGVYSLNYEFQQQDKIVVFPKISGARALDWQVKELSADRKNASFETIAWSLKEGQTYTAFFPYSENLLNHGDFRSITLDYSNQSVPRAYKKNDTFAYLNKYDYLYAMPTTPLNGQCSFVLKRLNYVLILKLDKIDGSKTYTKLEIKSKNGQPFVLKKNINTETGELSNATSPTNIMEMSLEYITPIMSSSGTSYYAWVGIAMPTPTTIPSGGLDVVLYDNSGVTYKGEIITTADWNLKAAMHSALVVTFK